MALGTYGIKVLFTSASATTDGLAQNADSEIQRTTSSTSSATVPNTTAFAKLVTLPAAGGGTDYEYLDVLPNDGTYRWYRVRHTLAGSDPSTFLATVLGAKPSLQIDP